MASRRTGTSEAAVPAEIEGQDVRARLPLTELVADSSDSEYWDLWLRLGSGDMLRLGRHLDDIADKKSIWILPSRDLPSPAGVRSVRPYYTRYNNLSIRSRPEPSAAPVTSAPASSQTSDRARRTSSRARRAARAIAMSFARAIVLRLPARRSIPSARQGRPHVSILIAHGYGMGGTVRTVFNQAAQLSRDYDVEIVSQFREREEPFFALPPGVRLTPLDDRTEVGRPRWPLRIVRDRLTRLPSLLVHESEVSFSRCTLWTDVQVVRRFRAQRGGVLMATRPSLNLLMAQLAAPAVITVGQEHMNFAQHREELAVDLHREYRRLDALTVLTRGDLDDYTKVLAGSRTQVVLIPNSVSPLTGGPADPSSRIMVAAGRLTRQKGFDRLIPAFDQVVSKHPDWTLRIYGSGPHRRRLQQAIIDRELYNNVHLMGRSDRMGEELAKGSVYVLSSRFEGFAMVILEAMSKGMAVVSFDCPRGPSDLITHGSNGLLVPDGDVDALARALLEVVEDEGRRRRLGAEALRTAEHYSADTVGRRWEDLLARLLSERAPAGRADLGS